MTPKGGPIIRENYGRNSEKLTAVGTAPNSDDIKHLGKIHCLWPQDSPVENKGLRHPRADFICCSDGNEPLPHRTEGHRSQQTTVDRADRARYIESTEPGHRVHRSPTEGHQSNLAVFSRA